MREPDAQSLAGGVTSSVRDLANWMRLQLSRGKLDGEQIVGMDAIDETHRPQILRSPRQNPALDRAGSTAWAGTSIGVPEAICRSFLDLALTGKVEKDWPTLFGHLFATAMAPNYGMSIDYAVPPKPLLPPLPAVAYTGIYDNELYGPIELRAAMALSVDDAGAQAKQVSDCDISIGTVLPISRPAKMPMARVPCRLRSGRAGRPMPSRSRTWTWITRAVSFAGRGRCEM